MVTRNPISAFGTVTGGTGRPAVRWNNDRGFSGTAVVTQESNGRYRWEINPLAVQLGANSITITATDTVGQTSARSVRVSYSYPAEDSPDDDDQPPRVTILSPNTTFLMTPAYSFAMRGTAFDFAGVTEVRWECSCGSRGTAQGTTNWTIPNISLPVGSYTIKVIAKDAAGNEGTANLTVFRYQN